MDDRYVYSITNEDQSNFSGEYDNNVVEMSVEENIDDIAANVSIRNIYI
jgi:hypothetical protein